MRGTGLNGSDWRPNELEISGASSTFTPASVNSHIWPKPGQIWGTLVRGAKKNERPGFRPRPWLEMNSLVAEEEDARGLVFSHVTHRPVEELVVFEIDLKEGWALGDSAGDQGFREWVFHVPL